MMARVFLLTVMSLVVCSLTAALIVTMPWWGSVIAFSVIGTVIFWTGLFLGWGAALALPRNDMVRLLTPPVLRRFDELTTRMMMAVALVVGDRVLKEALPFRVGVDYMEAAERRTAEIVAEEVSTMRQACREALDEMPM